MVSNIVVVNVIVKWNGKRGNYRDISKETEAETEEDDYLGVITSKSPKHFFNDNITEFFFWVIFGSYDRGESMRVSR